MPTSLRAQEGSTDTTSADTWDEEGHHRQNRGTAGVTLEDPSVIWAAAAAELRSELGGNYSAWFGLSKPVSVTADTFLLGVPNGFTKTYIETHYADHLRRALSSAAGRALDIAIVTREGLADSDFAPADHIASAREEALSAAPASPPPDDGSPAIHPRYTFDLFVIGPSNRFAHAAALAVGEDVANAYNPLFIYGGAGLGKTHLLHAIANYVNQVHPNLLVRYVSSEQFMNDFIMAIQRKSIPEFHRRYRAADVLLIDDIQFLEGKERTQEEFFHTFNALHPNSQIVITSDRAPKKIPALEERLRTRFEWGLMTDIQPPDLETRLAILRKKSEVENLQVPPDVLDFIASRVQTNIRELEGALIRVSAYASLTGMTVNLELAQNVLQSLLPDASETRVTADLVVSVAADYFGVTMEEIASSSRSRPLVTARQMAMYLCRELTDLSLPKIGERFGGRDHSTVIHATHKVKELMQEKQSAYEQVRELTARIRQQAARG